MSNQLSTSINPIPQSWIDALFAKMSSLYGNKFSDMWRDSNMQAVKSVWSEELGKLSRDEIARGANALITQEWPPTLPQFIKMCRIEFDPLSAYYEALNGAVARESGEMGEWSHPAIFWAMVAVGAFDIKNQTYSQIKARWESALADQVKRGSWADIPVPALALPVPSQKSEKAVAEKYIAETQVIKHHDEKVDHKRWAKNIMQRHRQGDKTLTHIQITFAKDALADRNGTLH
jgi:hypothetical protein